LRKISFFGFIFQKEIISFINIRRGAVCGASGIVKKWCSIPCDYDKGRCEKGGAKGPMALVRALKDAGKESSPKGDDSSPGDESPHNDIMERKQTGSSDNESDSACERERERKQGVLVHKYVPGTYIRYSTGTVVPCSTVHAVIDMIRVVLFRYIQT
jgi:hypothetical protein